MTRLRALVFTQLLAVLNAHGLTLNVRDFGAMGDGVALGTKAIQATMDKCTVAGGASMLSQSEVRDALIRGCQPQAAGGIFLKLTGENSRKVRLLANDLDAAG